MPMENELGLRLNHLGCINLLCDCSVHVPKDLRDCIERATESGFNLKWRRVLNRIEVEVNL